MTTFDRKTYFDSVRSSLFAGTLSQQQVDGQNFILGAWEKYVPNHDVRWLANFLAQSYHETSQQMWPIAEYGKGAGQPYGVPDPVTGQTYYGRGFIQLTWKNNYQRADSELGSSCVVNADEQLAPNGDCTLAARTGYQGMMEGWFRSPHKFAEYFNTTVDDPYNSRDIINGDKNIVPSWSNGVSIGQLIKGYHQKFLTALAAAQVQPSPPPVVAVPLVTVTISSDQPVTINLTLEGKATAVATT